MDYKNKTKGQLISELVSLRKRVNGLERLESMHQEAEKRILRLSKVVQNSNDAITVQDLEGIILDWNNGAELVYGWKPEEVIGTNISCIIPNDRREECAKMIQRLVKGEAVVSFETKRITKDGRFLDIWLTFGALSDENGEVDVIATIERDITDRKKNELALKNSEVRLLEQKGILEQKNATLKELLEQIEIEKKRIKDQVYANVENLLLPILKKLKIEKGIDHMYVDLLERNVMDLTSSFGIKVTDFQLRLSPREIEICNMVKSGFPTKDISRALNISHQTVERHRNNIRRKLGIVKKDINLTTYLQMYSSSGV